MVPRIRTHVFTQSPDDNVSWILIYKHIHWLNLNFSVNGLYQGSDLIPKNAEKGKNLLNTYYSNWLYLMVAICNTQCRLVGFEKKMAYGMSYVFRGKFIWWSKNGMLENIFFEPTIILLVKTTFWPKERFILGVPLVINFLYFLVVFFVLVGSFGRVNSGIPYVTIFQHTIFESSYELISKNLCFTFETFFSQIHLRDTVNSMKQAVIQIY